MRGDRMIDRGNYKRRAWLEDKSQTQEGKHTKKMKNELTNSKWIGKLYDKKLRDQRQRDREMKKLQMEIKRIR